MILNEEDRRLARSLGLTESEMIRQVEQVSESPLPFAAAARGSGCGIDDHDYPVGHPHTRTIEKCRATDVPGISFDLD